MTSLGRHLCPILTALLAFSPMTAVALENTVPEEPELTVKITPERPHLQEEIVQDIRVIVRYPFAELDLDLPPVSGAETLILQQPKNRQFETYGSEGYLYETRRGIFPTQSGELVIPPVRVRGVVSASRDDKRPFDLVSDAVTLDVRPPPETFGDASWLVAHDVAVEDVWSRSLDQLRAGDRFSRFVTATVTGATGAHLPELVQEKSYGITVLPGESERSTEITPDGVVGKISRSFEFRVDFDLPIDIVPVRVAWWHTDREEPRISATPSIRIEPLPRDVDAMVSSVMAEQAARREESRRGIVAVSVGGAVLALALALWLLASRWKTTPADRQLRRTLAKDPSALHVARALSAWASASFPAKPPMTLLRLGQTLGPEAEERIARLQAAAYGEPSKGVDAARLALDILGMAQRRRRQTMRNSLSETLDRLLGPETRLPEIGARPSQDVR